MSYPTCNSCERPLRPSDVREQLTPTELRQFIFLLQEDLEHDELLGAIVQLDAHVSDWQFTLRLADHFDRLRSQYNAEVAGDQLANRLRPRFTATDQPYGQMPKVD